MTTTQTYSPKFIAEMLIKRANVNGRVNELNYDRIDQEFVGLLNKLTKDEFMTIPHKIRFDLCFIPITELVNYNGLRFYILKDVSGSYIIRCYADDIHWDTIVIDTYDDAVKLTQYISKPHWKTLESIRKYMN